MAVAIDKNDLHRLEDDTWFDPILPYIICSWKFRVKLEVSYHIHVKSL